MDELWMDVTALIDGHLNAWPAADADGQRWFSLPGKHAALKGDAASSTGFHYSATAATGHVDSALPSLRFIIASYLAAHLRELLQSQMSLSASAGIAPNKALAKLAGAAHKPAQQTLFAPSDPRDYAAYVAKRRLRSLGGFGSSIVERITDALAASRGSEPSAEQHPADASSLTTAEVRKRIDRQAFIHAFGTAGPRLWAALWGQDSTSVVHAPEFPSTISIEDTYTPTGAPASALSTLTAALMRRLDFELRGKESKAPRFVRTDRPAWGEGGGPLVRCYEQIDDGEVGPWMRWPAGLRLSTMSGGWGSRVSRQTAMPVELL
jgi:nucleotidyltransferase/DNA polymerase involved in DNA repair